MEELESGRFRKKTLLKGYIRRASDTSAKEVPEETVRSISYFTLFRYTSKFDVFLITVALLSTIVSGVSLPLAIAVVARAFGDMIEYEKSAHKGNQDADDFLASMYAFGINYSTLGVIIFVCGYLGSAFINIAAVNQVFKMREAYIKAVLNQDCSYYDTRQTGDFASKMSENILKLQDGIGDKLSITMYNITIAAACMSMALFKGWKLALMCLISSPISFLLVGLTGVFAQRFSKKEAKESGLASAIAEDVLSSIRTVYSFNGQQTEVHRYSACLANVKKIDIKKVFFTGLAMSLLIICMFSSYGLSFYFGVYLVLNDPANYNAEVMFSVFFMVMSGLTSLGMLGTLVGTFGTARGAGANIFSVLDNKPSINPLLDRGLKPSFVEGNIDFKNVMFRYLSRPGSPVLQGLTFSVKHGQSVALVGRSGCGKSTAIRLILRHYDVSSGNVMVDGHDVRDLSVRWLRAQVGLVGQEPVLFNTTVRENIRYGREDATDADIEAAARQANAHNFIINLPKGYRTLVGERGTSLSGGQKQRIAIARALIRNPVILLLDEATSALDTTCEAKVQKALDMAAKGRTTVIVAHRLSTIRNVDVIYVLDKGKVAEQGTHEELMKAQGLYYNMQLLQGSLELSQPTKEFSAVDAVRKESEISVERRSVISVISISEEERRMPPLSFRQLISLNAPDRTILIIGCTTSIVTGFALPIYVLCFGDLLSALSNPDLDVVMAKSIKVGVTFVAIGFLIGTFTLIEHMSFGVAGASLAQRLRGLMFQHLMRQDVAFYDKRVNSTGALCARLSADAAYVRAATGQRIGAVLQGVGCIGLALTLAMVHEWRVALVALAFFPLVFLVMHYEGKASSHESFKDASSVEESTKIAVEAVSNVRTVVSLGREQKFIEEYTTALRPAIGPAKRAAHFRGIVTGLSRSIFNFMNSAALILGAQLIVDQGIRYENILIATQSLQLASGQLQAAFTYSADFQKGIRAASRVLAFLNTKPTVVDPEKPFVAPFVSSGSAQYKQVEFSYPTRPGVKALCGLDLQLPAGKTIALVGESGCGKSTTVCLLQRFYDAEAGIIAMDGIPLQQLLVDDVRGNLGLVSQEPVLFNRTIRENIAYGDNSRSPTDEEIVAVATQANIHKFIQALPQGYNTTIGSKGVQLSGGQKQRVAIARALVRHPKILLLDEATSALDSESEKVVQAALDRAKEGRTCLMVAHRLSTVRDVDEICVFQSGHIVERGTHTQLMDRKGVYYNLYQRGL